MEEQSTLEPERPLNKTPLDKPKPPSMANAIYWQTLAGLVGFAISLAVQMLAGFQILLALTCGVDTGSSDFINCHQDLLAGGFLVSLAATSGLAAAIGVFLVGTMRKIKGSFLFAWAVTYLYFAFLASQNRYFFEQNANSEPTSAYLLAGLAILGCFVAAISYHVPKLILDMKIDPPDQNPKTGTPITHDNDRATSL